MFYKVVWQHTQGIINNVLLQIYSTTSQWKNFENRLKFYRDITMNMMSPFYETRRRAYGLA